MSNNLRAGMRELREDLARSYPIRAQYDIVSTVIDRLDVLLAAEPAPRPVIDREALDRRLETAKGHSWSIETTVDAVMELARPMPTREQIKEHLSLHWAFATDEEADEMTNAVVSLFGRSES